MKVIDCVQGSAEWQDARIGIPTASQADCLLTPKTRKPSTQSVAYRNRLLAEWLTGYPLEPPTTLWMDRGVEMEAKAREFYEFHRDVEVEQVGFCLRDDRLFGGSPDGLVGEDGGLEIKCPALHTHVGYLLGAGPDYLGQVQSYLYLTGREWWDVVSYNPDLPPAVIRVERDVEYIEALTKALDVFCADLAEQKEKLLPYRMVEDRSQVVHPVEGQLGRSLVEA